MAEQVMVPLPKSLYDRAVRLARTRHQEVTAALTEAITLAEEAMEQEQQEEQQMAREEQAYQTLYEEFLTTYTGEYVAIYQGQLVDHDADELALLHRLNKNYPHEVVLMKQVRPQPEPDLYFRSPRFVR